MGIRETARTYLLQVPLEPGQITSNGDTAALFTRLSGITHNQLLVSWGQAPRPDGTTRADPAPGLTSCNSFVANYAGAAGIGIGKPGRSLGQFNLDKKLASWGKSFAWVPATEGARPKFGDIFEIATTLHQGIRARFRGQQLEHGRGRAGRIAVRLRHHQAQAVAAERRCRHAPAWPAQGLGRHRTVCQRLTARPVLVPWRGRVLRGELLGKLDGENRGYREDLGLGTKAQVHPANVWSQRLPSRRWRWRMVDEGHLIAQRLALAESRAYRQVATVALLRTHCDFLSTKGSLTTHRRRDVWLVPINDRRLSRHGRRPRHLFGPRSRREAERCLAIALQD